MHTSYECYVNGGDGDDDGVVQYVHCGNELCTHSLLCTHKCGKEVNIDASNG